MKHILATIISVLFVSVCSAQTVQSIEEYEISTMRGQQIYYASHIKREHMKNSDLIDDQDRAAMLGAMGKTGVSMPKFSEPYVEDTKMSNSHLTIMTAKLDNGDIKSIAKIDHKGGSDRYVVMNDDNTTTLLLMNEGVTQTYTIHNNVTFPSGGKLITCTTTRNRPLGVTTITVSGEATRVK